MKISVIGQGYVGLPLAIALAESMNTVIGFDLDPMRVLEITNGNLSLEFDQKKILDLMSHNKYTPTANPNDLGDSDA